MTLLKTV